MLEYRYQEDRLPFFIRALKFRIYDRFTRQASPVFLRGGDSISTSPMVAGHYEKELVTLLEATAKAGYDSALIDIGANVGLSTYYAGRAFKAVHCFEPNPKVFHILSANLFEFEHVHLNCFGLGARDEDVTLTVPKINYGGAFVLNPGNSYSLQELTSKDGFSDFKKENYDELPVKIKKGREVLAKIFSQIDGGVTFKMDVEGFESTVLGEIAAALPLNRKFAIVFENWSQSFTPDSLHQVFNRPLKLFKLQTAIDPKGSKLSKFLQLLIHGRKYALVEAPKNWIGTLLITDGDLRVS